MRQTLQILPAFYSVHYALIMELELVLILFVHRRLHMQRDVDVREVSPGDDRLAAALWARGDLLLLLPQ